MFPIDTSNFTVHIWPVVHCCFILIKAFWWHACVFNNVWYAKRFEGNYPSRIFRSRTFGSPLFWVSKACKLAPPDKYEWITCNYWWMKSKPKPFQENPSVIIAAVCLHFTPSIDPKVSRSVWKSDLSFHRIYWVTTNVKLKSFKIISTW